ncbi:MAG: hypothetical protein HZB13_21810 [Acidobacteria bacterium]|nr:hypothetical protein [Acidobacteriota bacterium]
MSGRISTVKRYPVSTGAEDAAQRTTYNYDTAVNGWGRVASVVTGQGYTEAFEYSAGGLVSKKSLTAPGALRALAAVCGYDNEGKRTSLKYPDLTNDAGYVAFTGKTVTTSFDSFGRLPVGHVSNFCDVSDIGGSGGVLADSGACACLMRHACSRSRRPLRQQYGSCVNSGQPLVESG